MKRKLCRIGCLLIFLSLVGCQVEQEVARPAVSAPRPPVDPEQVCCGGWQTPKVGSKSTGSEIVTESFGELNQGEVLTRTFLLANRGSSPVKLDGEISVSYPCCVEAEINRGEIAPGDSATVRVTFDSAHRPGPIDIFVNLPFDSDSISKQIHLGGKVRSEFVVSPTGLKFDKPGVIDVTVTGEGLFTDYQITGVDNRVQGLTVREKSRSKNTIVFEAVWEGPSSSEKIEGFEILSTHKLVPSYPVLVAPPGVEVD